MAGKRQSNIGSFLQQVESAKKLSQQPLPNTNVAENTAEAQQKVVQDTQKKAEDVSKATTGSNINKAAGLQYVAPPPVKPQVNTPSATKTVIPEVTTPLPPLSTAAGGSTQFKPLEELVGKEEFAKQANQAAVDAATKTNQQIDNMGQVKQTFLTSVKYKELFGSEMPAEVESQFGSNYQSILDYLKAPSATEGQFRKLSDVELAAQQSQNAGVDPESVYSTLGGLKGKNTALDIQANLGALQDAASKNEYLRQQAAGRPQQQADALAALLESKSAGKSNLEKVKTEAKKFDESQKKSASEIEKGLMSDYTNKEKQAVNQYKNTLDTFPLTPSASPNPSALPQVTVNEIYIGKVDKALAQLERYKDKLTPKDYEFYKKRLATAKQSARNFKPPEANAPSPFPGVGIGMGTLQSGIGSDMGDITQILNPPVSKVNDKAYRDAARRELIENWGVNPETLTEEAITNYINSRDGG
jgi:hypothetical protein